MDYRTPEDLGERFAAVMQQYLRKILVDAQLAPESFL
jgi:hypothetical protein